MVTEPLAADARNRWWYAWAAGAALLAYIALAVWKIGHPHFFFDELLYLGVALRGREAELVHSSLWGWPWMLMPYVGALKGYLYYPWLQLVEPNAWTLRAPMILVLAASLGVTAYIIRKTAGAGPALAALAVLAVHPELVLFGKFDCGPVVLGVFLRCVLLLALLRILDNRAGLGTYLGLLGASLLGMYHKMTFIWFLNAFYPAAGLILLLRNAERSWPERFRLQRAPLAVLGLAWLLGAVWFFLLLGSGGLTDVMTHPGYRAIPRLPHHVMLVSGMLQGTGLSTLFLHVPPPRSGFLVGRMLLGILVLAIAFFFWRGIQAMRGRIPWDRRTAWGVLAALGTLLLWVQLAAVRMAAQPWHVLSLFPAVPVVLALFAADQFKAWQRRRPRTARWAAVVLTLAGVTYGLGLNLAIQPRLGEAASGTRGWARLANTPGVERFIAYLKSHPDRRYALLDWGMYFPALLALPADRLHPLWLLPPARKVPRVIMDQDVFVTHGDEAKAFPSLKADFIQGLERFGLSLRRFHAIRDPDGLVVFEFWSAAADTHRSRALFALAPENAGDWIADPGTRLVYRPAAGLEMSSGDGTAEVEAPWSPGRDQDLRLRLIVDTDQAARLHVHFGDAIPPRVGYNKPVRLLPGAHRVTVTLPKGIPLPRLRLDAAGSPAAYRLRQ